MYVEDFLSICELGDCFDASVSPSHLPGSPSPLPVSPSPLSVSPSRAASMIASRFAGTDVFVVSTFFHEDLSKIHGDGRGRRQETAGGDGRGRRQEAWSKHAVTKSLLQVLPQARTIQWFFHHVLLYSLRLNEQRMKRNRPGNGDNRLEEGGDGRLRDGDGKIMDEESVKRDVEWKKEMMCESTLCSYNFAREETGVSPSRYLFVLGLPSRASLLDGALPTLASPSGLVSSSPSLPCWAWCARVMFLCQETLSRVVHNATGNLLQSAKVLRVMLDSVLKNSTAKITVVAVLPKGLVQEDCPDENTHSHNETAGDMRGTAGDMKETAENGKEKSELKGLIEEIEEEVCTLMETRDVYADRVSLSIVSCMWLEDAHMSGGFIDPTLYEISHRMGDFYVIRDSTAWHTDALEPHSGTVESRHPLSSEEKVVSHPKSDHRVKKKGKAKQPPKRKATRKHK